MRNDNMPSGIGRLRLDENVLSWLTFGSDPLMTILDMGDLEGLAGFVFEDAMLTRNTFTSAPHVHAASTVTAHGNVFDAAADGRVGLLASSAVSGTGNIGPDGWDNSAELILRSDSNAAKEAANSRLVVVI